MKVQITLSPYQLQVIRECLVYSSLNNKLINNQDPSWQELKQLVQLAHDRLTDNATNYMTITQVDE